MNDMERDHGRDNHRRPVPAANGLDRRAFLRQATIGAGAILLGACGVSELVSTTTTNATTSASGSGSAGTVAGGSDSAILPGLDAFGSAVTVYQDGGVWRVESTGMPAHTMMVGITSWQQQVPVPQPYAGANAWTFPTAPELSNSPVSARTGLFRGAIAVAANGVPVFNALNNRGDDAFLAGELDRWGGHAGRADDYHYHIAPLHLEEQVGLDPIAYALDGFPIYGSSEPDGSAVGELDEYNGHEGDDGYHYHGTETYPYINGGLRGVVETTDQVEPQPITSAFRPAGEPLPGATITAFETVSVDSYRLVYDLDGSPGAVEYEVGSDEVRFVFTDPSGSITEATYDR